MSGGDELVSSFDDISKQAAEFSKSLDFKAESEIAAQEHEGLGVESQLIDDGDIDIKSTWADDDEEPGKPLVSKDNPSEKPLQTIKFKANGEDIELSLEEAQKRLSLAEGARQALNDRAKLKKEVTNLKKQSEELSRYKDTWEKLESVKHDRKQLLELITGESYDELIEREAEKRQIHQYGSPEQKQLLDYAERVQKLERERELENGKRESQIKQAEQSKFDAEAQRVQTAMEREFYKHQLPEDLDPSAQNKLKAMLWKQSAADLKEYYNKYGKITNKMVEKAFADNANVMLRSNNKVVEKKVAEIRDTQKQAAKEKAQIASVKNSENTVDAKLANMNPNQLFDFFRKGR
jgi:hypothetical protein